MAGTTTVHFELHNATDPVVLTPDKPEILLVKDLLAVPAAG